MKYRIIGGVRDGEFFETDSPRRVSVITVARKYPVKDIGDYRSFVSFDKDVYELDCISFKDGRTIEFYRHIDISQYDAMKKLFGY